jgi:hypothetical protein
MMLMNAVLVGSGRTVMVAGVAHRHCGGDVCVSSTRGIANRRRERRRGRQHGHDECAEASKHDCHSIPSIRSDWLDDDSATFTAAGVLFFARPSSPLVPALRRFRVDPVGALRHE